MRLIKGFVFLYLISLQLIGATSFALPFSVLPNGPLPTEISTGQTLPASYIVANNTAETRSGNFVKYLPPNVTQDTTGVGACGSTFTLSPHNTVNDHCILNLSQVQSMPVILIHIIIFLYAFQVGLLAQVQTHHLMFLLRHCLA